MFVTAHLDSWDPAESAADNAIGMAGLVLLARRLADGPQPAVTVRFVATGAEEQGLQGAVAYVRDNPLESEDADLVVNLDVLWAPEGTFVVMGEPEHVALALDAAEAEGLEGVDGGLPNPSSDQFAWQAVGVPAFWAGRFGFREYHTHADVADALDWEDAARALRVYDAVLEAAVR